MTAPTVEKVVSEFAQLSTEQQREALQLFRQKLTGTDQHTPDSSKPEITSDRSREYTWLDQHRDEYANQWVALNGCRLVSHGAELKEVIAAARRAGESDALMIFVEPSTAPPFLMLWS